MSFDLDGVICRPPLGLNVGISRNLAMPPLPATIPAHKLETSAPGRIALARLIHWLRYLSRRPLDDAASGLKAIQEYRTPVLVTARSAIGISLVEAWLTRHGLLEYFSAVYANDTALRGAQFKLHKASSVGASEHVDDDGATAFYMANQGMPTVYLRDWPGNRGLPYPSNVRVIRSLTDLAELLAAASSSERQEDL